MIRKDILTKEEQKWIRENSGKIRLAYDPSWPPYEFQSDEAVYSGLSADFIHLIEQKLNFKFQIIHTSTWFESYTKFLNKEVDVLPSVAKNQKRVDKMRFTDSYYSATAAIIVNQTDKNNYQMSQLIGKKIGVIKEYSVEKYLQNKYSELTLVPFMNHQTAFQQLMDGQIDAFIEVPAIISYYLGDDKLSDLRVAGDSGFVYHLSMATHIDSPMLNRILNKGLKMIDEKEMVSIKKNWIKLGFTKEKNNQYIYLLLLVIVFLILIIFCLLLLSFFARFEKVKKITFFHYIYQVSSNIIKNYNLGLILFFIFIIIFSIVVTIIVYQSDKDILTNEERKWLNSLEKPVLFCPCPEYPPIDFIDNQSNYSGITRDILRLIEDRINYQFELIHLSTWQELIDSVKNKKVDFVSSIQKTDERSEYLRFTQPYFIVKTVFITRNNFNEPITSETICDLTICITKGYAVTDYIKEKYPDAQLLYVKGNLEGLLKVSFGEADMMVIDLPLATYLIDKNAITNLKVTGFTGYEYQLRFGIRDDYPLLDSILQKGLMTISKREIKRVSDNWIGIESGDVKINQSSIYFLVAGLIFILVIILLILIWNRTLKRKVNQQTRALQRELEERKQIE
ncbi:MAG: transporter substrate-binding domain-containing protein, partial [Spirochaetes bacterium]|nr:transporter substrate-binding domain-containing protein [Spirochaetota bacterium]